MLRNLVCDHELEAFVQITTLSSSDYQGGSPQLHKDATTIFHNDTRTHIMLLITKKTKKKKKTHRP